MVEYEAYLLKLARHVIFIIDIESERVRCIVRGLRIPIYMST